MYHLQFTNLQRPSEDSQCGRKTVYTRKHLPLKP